MHKTIRRVCLALGTALLLAALFLVVYNLREDRQSGEQAAGILSQLRSEIPGPTEAPEFPAEEQYDLFAEYVTESAEPEEMPALDLDGSRYIGIVTIPALSTELPVQADWSYPALKTSPCRYSGSTASGDLVICAHNYRSHFGRIGELRAGDEILFTDISGQVSRYAVLDVEQIAGTNVGQMYFGAGDWDLTLFTCTLSGQSRVTVRAERLF